MTKRFLIMGILLSVFTLIGCNFQGDLNVDGEIDAKTNIDTDDLDNTEAVCGDGIVDAGESCDDEIESVNCNVDCTLVSCGDSIVNATAGETCDDGNMAVGDGCGSTCQALQSITISSNSATVVRGSTLQFTATGNYADSSTEDLTSFVSWSISDNTKGSIDTNGLILAEELAVVDVAASLAGINSNVLSIEITLPALVSIEITSSNAIIDAGLTEQYTAIGTYENSSSYDITSEVTWDSTDMSVATVSTSGLAQTLIAGTTDISASLNSVTSNVITLTVGAPTPTGIYINYADDYVSLSASPTFIATATYTDGLAADLANDGSVVWSSSDIGIADIGGNGVLSPAAEGIVEISASWNGFTAPVFTVSITPESGLLDQNFGIDIDGNGTVDGVSANTLGYNATAANEEPMQAIVDSQGRFVIAGFRGLISTNTNNQCVIWRFNADATPDTTFGIDYDSDTILDGYLVVELAVGCNFKSIAEDSSGNYIVGGIGHNGTLTGSTNTWDGILIRILENGSVDTTFGNGLDYDGDGTPDGLAMLHINQHDEIKSIAIDSQGKIAFAGTYCMTCTTNARFTGRYTADGTPDITFGGDYDVNGVLDGVWFRDSVGWWDFNNSILIDNEDNIYAGGAASPTTCCFNYGWVIAKDWADGSGLDTAYGAVDGGATNGDVYINYNDSIDWITDMKFDKDGNLWFTGVGMSGGNWNNISPILGCITADGSAYCPGFNNGTGAKLLPEYSTGNIAYALDIDSKNRIVIGATVARAGNNGAPYDMQILRIMPDGTIDQTFGTDTAPADGNLDGSIRIDNSATGHDILKDVIIAPDDSIYGIGSFISSSDGTRDIVIVHLNK
ncbi:MAG: Ig-like domain-containing protein [Spirochaetia bacterium]|nr:Ig-like domain-containing protein [Spirochaetia bacterium]